MPLNRYHIRNECSLADPELYRAADKDDPEALLEGVAMAGLVGVLRQLGDLAEFAAEVFHDLHEEVMATAVRGHSLMVRVQQLEAEFPSIERAFLSQTNHSSFFYNAGVDWHPNMRMDQNLIAQGDWPRFIMDSYEECRGPPRLFLLDKFDVAGAGACLKRYTDPSFFKAEASDVQREKRIRRGKKKGSRWRNGETPEVLPTSRVKLHHLLLEERIENTVSDPARPVKLKRRLNGFPFHSKTGESYMEKFLKIASPEHTVVQEISVCSSPLKLPANSTYETELDRNDISWESPDQEFRHRCLSLTPDVDGTVQNLSMDNLKEVTSDNGISESPRASHSFEAKNDLSTFYGEVREKEITVVGKTKTEGSIDGYQSDDVASEVDNYVDAHTTMESEMDTDSELRTKSDLQVLSSKRQMSGFYASEAQQQSNLSDSQSIGSSMLSDDGNSSFKKGISSSSFSDTPSISADTMPLKGEVSTKGFLSNEIFEAKGTARPQNQISDNEDIGLALSTGRGNAYAGMGVADVPAYRPDHGKQTISSLTFFPPTLAHTDADSPVREHVMEKGETEETLCACNAPKNELIYDTVSETNLNISVSGDSITSDAPLRTENHSSPRLSAENQAVDGLDDKYLNVDGVLPCMSNLSDFSCNTRDALSFADFPENKHLEDLNSEENLSSSSSAYQPLDELGDINSNIMEHPPEVSPEDPLINGLDTEDPNVISGASNADPNVFSGASVHISSTIDAAPEEAKSENSMDSIPQTEAAEDGHVEYPVGNQTFLSISIMPHAEDQCHNLSLPELETAMESDFIVSEPDDVIPPAAEVAVSVIPVMDSPDDFHSKDLHISGTTDKIQPFDPAANSTDDQIDSPVPVMSHAEEQSLDLTRAELETRRKGAEPDDVVPDVDDMISLSGDIAGDTKPVMESPKNCNVKEPQASVITNDIPSSAHEEKTVVTPYMDSNDATGVTISPDCYSLTRNVHLSEADAERDEAEAAPFLGLEEDGNQCSSLCLDLKKFDEDSLSNFRGPNQSRMEAEVSVPDCYSESDVVKEVGIPEVASLDLGSDLSETLHHDHTESEVLDNVPDSYSEVESSLDLGHAATTSSFWQQIGLDTNGVPSQTSNLIGHTENTSLLPIHHDAEEQKVELSLIRLDEEETKVLHNAVEANLVSSPQLEQESSLDCLDQAGCSNTASASLLPNLPCQPSVSKLLPRKNCSVDDIGQPKDPFTISPVVGLLPEAKISVEEMPPLPPLPPVQWRMEKYQHASSAQEKDAPPSNAGAFPSLSPSIADPNGHPANSSLPHYDIAGENSPLVYEYMPHNQVQDGPVLLQVPPIVHHENNMNLLPSLGEKQSVNHPLPLPGNFDEMLQIDSHVGEKENIQPSLSTFPQGTSVDTASTYASGQPHEDASQRQHQVAPETSSKDEKLDQGSAYAEGNMNTNDTDALLRVIENEQPQNVMPNPAGEIALQAQSGGKANGDRTTKLPRPRNPLIDAVVAIDKSKLRKVTERPRPQIQKVDERDSLLEQIRAKSFNLKPTVVSRPSIQGPATNLQVAAILEKAKTIRQAFAGSDEDDGEDSWSDS